MWHFITKQPKLDVFRVSASADATMATWGGSTVDNLESITEDDDGQRGGTNMEEEEDDGKLVSLWAVRILTIYVTKHWCRLSSAIYIWFQLFVMCHVSLLIYSPQLSKKKKHFLKCI